MHIKFQIRGALGPEPGMELDPFLFRLLEAIRRQGTLNQAVRLVGCSYRHAWGLIKRWEEALGTPLVTLQRGRGAQLTAFGERLLWTQQRLEQETAERRETYAGELNEALAEFSHRDRPLRLRLHASHDPAVQHLNDLLNSEPGLETELQTHGSLESLYGLNTGQCHIAGFHFPLGSVGEALLPRYRRWLDDRRHTLLFLATRRQGLMTQAGNPKRIHALGDLTKRRVRFINRQRGSGTRTVFDQLLAEAGIQPARILGYDTEEFTHFAVAAMVASGAADAGFGLQAAAARFHLSFIPILQERYLIAINNELGSDLTSTIRRVLDSPRFHDPMARLEGYDTARAGTPIRLTELAA